MEVSWKRESNYTKVKQKKVFKTDDPNLLIVSYKDDATAFNGEKKGTIEAKGVVNNRVSNHMMSLLEQEGIKTHYVKTLNDRETLVRSVKIIPLEVIMRNIAAGSFKQTSWISRGNKAK